MKTIIFSIITSALVFIAPSTFAKSHYGLNFCSDPDFECIRVKSGQSWKRLFPDAYQRQIVQRLNRMNTRLRYGMKIAVPRNLAQTDLIDIAPFPETINAPGDKLIVVDPPSMAWGAYDGHGNLVHWGPMSGGKNYCRDVGRNCQTVSGKFHIYHKKGPKCESKKFPVGRGGAPMPHCMFFHAGYALHASPYVPGYHDSHGCVRIFKEDAKWLNEEFVRLPSENNKGTTVIVNPYI